MLRNNKLNICDLFISIWGIYYLQDVIYPQGLINQLLQLIMIGLGILSLFQCLRPSIPNLIKATLLLLFMYMVYGSVILMFGDGISWTSDSSYLKTSMNSLLPIVFFYQQTHKQKLSEKRIKIYFFFLLTITIVHFMHMEKVALLALDQEDNTNNVGYMVLALFPYVFLFSRRPILQNVILSLLMLYVLWGMKRGAIFIGVILSILALYSIIKEQTLAKKILFICISLALVFAFVFYVQQMLVSSEYFALRIQNTMDGDTSGRSEIYSSIWSAVKHESNIFYLLFGHGANSSIVFAGNFAHNDWLETICNNGILGVCLLLYFFYSFIATLKSGRARLENKYYYCFLALFIISISKTIFSMSIQNFDLCQAMLIGYFTSKIYNHTGHNL